MAELKRAVSFRQGAAAEKKTAVSGEGNARELRKMASGLSRLHDKQEELEASKTGPPRISPVFSPALN